MKQLTLNVKSRKEIGRGPSRRLRVSGMIPAVVYGASGNHNLVVGQAEFRSLQQASGGGSVLVQIAGDGLDPTLSIVSELQVDALSDAVIHIDFHEVESGKVMSASAMVQIIGEAVGVKMEEGVLQVSAHELDVRCLPADLPEHIEIDVSELHVGGTIQVADLAPPEGVEFVDSQDRVVVTCLGKSAEALEEEAAEAAAEAAAAAEAEEGEGEAEGGEPGADSDEGS